MGLVATLKRSPLISVTLIVAVVLVVGIYVLNLVLAPPAPSGKPVKLVRQDWFSTDDGASYFADDSTKAAPWKKDGQEVLQAMVYQCGNEKPYVAYLVRFTEAAHKMFAADIASGGKPRPSPLVVGEGNVEVKRPGDKEWLKLSAGPEKISPIMDVRCPDGEEAVRIDP